MNRALRRDYLTALGLETWMLRARVSVSVPAVARESAAEAASMAGVSAPAAADAASSAGVFAAAAAEAASPAGVFGAAAAPAAGAAGVSVPTALRFEVPPALDAPSAAGSAREAGCDWRQLRDRVAACTRCGLAATRTQTVFGVGDPHAHWLVVGEAPGADEDRAGEPFVGRAGQLLNSMLRAIGLAREQVYIANVLKCRPPHNRDPLAGETLECLPYLDQQIALLQPKIMLGVGRIAAQNLLHTDISLSRLRQKVHAFGAARVPLVVTYHPAYLLRTPADKRKAWEDLKFAREVFTRG